MSMPRIKLVSLCLLALGVLAAIWVVATASPPVSLTVLGFTTVWSPDYGREYVIATIALSNASSRVITYYGRDPKGWLEARGIICSLGPGAEHTLAPSQAITFEEKVERD